MLTGSMVEDHSWTRPADSPLGKSDRGLGFPWQDSVDGGRRFPQSSARRDVPRGSSGRSGHYTAFSSRTDGDGRDERTADRGGARSFRPLVTVGKDKRCLFST